MGVGRSVSRTSSHRIPRTSRCTTFACTHAWALLVLRVGRGHSLAQLEQRLARPRQQAVSGRAEQAGLRELGFVHDLGGAMPLQLLAETVYQRV